MPATSSSPSPPSHVAARLYAEVMARAGRRAGPEIVFRCPCHSPDQHPSARYNPEKLVWYCPVCGAGGGWKNLAEHLGIPIPRLSSPSAASGAASPPAPSPRKASKPPIGVTLDEYSGAKQLPVDFLQSLGMQNDPSGEPRLHIPYKNPDGSVFRVQIRHRMDKSAGRDDRFSWGSGEGQILYGLEDLDAIRSSGYVVLVEGTSDRQTAKYHGFPCLGLPGASGWSEARDAEHLVDLAIVYVVIEPDTGGQSVLQWIAKSEIRNRVHLVRLGEHKDVSALHLSDPPRFKERFQRALEAAVPWTEHQLDHQREQSAGLAGLLEDIDQFIRWYVWLGAAELTAICLWVLHTWASEAAESTPYLAVGSPEKRSGKTRLLETLSLVVAKPWLSGRVSAAVLVRKIAKEGPTLLLDETDAAFKGDREYTEALRAILNSGHRRGGVASLCVRAGNDYELRDYPVFSPKALAGIGKLPDTVADRSISIVLKRRLPSESVQRFRHREAEAKAKPVRSKCAAWAAGGNDWLADARPDIPAELDDRAADGWEPLLAIADAAGGDWPKRARSAALALSGGAAKEDESLGPMLLRDVAAVLGDRNDSNIFTADLLKALFAVEEGPWGDLSGKPLDARKLASRLKPYGIRPHTVRVGDKTAKGYSAEDFNDAFHRYVPEIAVTSVTPSHAHDSAPAPSENVTAESFDTLGVTNSTVTIGEGNQAQDRTEEGECDGVTDVTLNPGKPINAGIDGLPEKRRPADEVSKEELELDPLGTRVLELWPGSRLVGADPT
jgi:hypothetical protein